MNTATLRASQQELEVIAGVDERILCAPAALLTAAREQGYEIDTKDYVSHLDWSAYKKSNGWSRPGLGRMLRDTFGVANISWWIGATGISFGESDLENMRTSGYVRTAQELDALQTLVPYLSPETHGVLELVANGYHVVVTVLPGFGLNTTHHAILLTSYDIEQGTVSVFNPDSRTAENAYDATYLSTFLSKDGACTIILPRPVTP